MADTGLIIVVSAPSGAGKSTLLNSIRERNPSIRFSVSATTRSPREGEADGINYLFKSRDDFEEMIKNNRLVEWDEYCGNYYGTPREYIESSIKEGFDVVLDITVKGALRMKEQYPECIMIFVLPPSLKELKRRIEKRGTENSETISMRMDQAKQELSYAGSYEYMIVNDGIPRAVGEMECIISAEKLKAARNTGVLRSLMKEEF